MNSASLLRRLTPAAAALLVAGCASVAPRDSFQASADLARPGAGLRPRWAR